eukprot:241910_1
MSGNALTVAELHRMMLVFDESYYKKSFLSISEEFTSSFIKELDLDSDNNGDDDESKSFKSNEHFRFLLASTLITLLNDRFNSQRRLQIAHNKVINHGFFKPLQRLIALYLVYNLYGHKAIAHHPFLPHFMEIIDHCPHDNQTENDDNEKGGDEKLNINNNDNSQTDDDSELMFEKLISQFDDENENNNDINNKLNKRFGPLCDKIEAEFIVKLLFNRDIDVISKMSPIKFTKVYCDKLINKKLEKWPDFAQVQEIISAKRNKNFSYSPLKTLGLNPILRDYDLNLDLKLAPFAVDDNVISDLALNSEFNYATFDPEIVRPKPPFIIPFKKEEIKWAFLGIEPKLIWDYGNISPNNMGSEMKINTDSSLKNINISDLIDLSLEKELNEQQLKILISEMKIPPYNIINYQFTPNKLNILCINNPKIAIQIFLILKQTHTQTNNKLFDQYLNALCTLNVADVETAKNSMNFMKQIAMKIKIPKKSIVQFISHCIKTCEDTKEPFHQTRLVRYICVFVEELINNKIISIKDTKVEIEPFCLEFSRFPQATKLYQLLKKQNISSNDKANEANNNNDNQ